MESNSEQRVGIIGAGIAGLSAARALVSAGFRPVVLDKGRGVGGRTSRRRGARAEFDHGAQYFTARDARFRREAERWCAAGVAAPFDVRIGVVDRVGCPRAKEGEAPERFVGVPGMNAMAKDMAIGLDVRTGSRVARIERSGDAWSLVTTAEERVDGLAAVLVTAPTEQAAELLAPHSDELAALARSVDMQPSAAALLAFEAPLAIDLDALFVNDGPLRWVARNSAKSGRPDTEAWVMHAGADWSRAHWDDAPESMAEELTAALRETLGLGDLPARLEAQVHRWRYALAQPALDVGRAIDTTLPLALAGDWLHGSKVEGAWLSGRSAADALGQRLAEVPQA